MKSSIKREKKVPFKFTLITEFHSSMLDLCANALAVTPAQLISVISLACDFSIFYFANFDSPAGD